MGNVARGLVPRWGGGGAWQNPPCQPTISGFSFLGVPAAAGMSDYYENKFWQLPSIPLYATRALPIVTPAPDFDKPSIQGVARATT